MLIVKQKAGSNYQHSNVKEAWLNATQSHIENNEAEMISLRALSKKVAVTPSAAYNPFIDKIATTIFCKFIYATTFKFRFLEATVLIVRSRKNLEAP